MSENYKFDVHGNVDKDPKGWKFLGMFLVALIVMNFLSCSGWWIAGLVVVFLLLVLNDAYVKGDI